MNAPIFVIALLQAGAVFAMVPPPVSPPEKTNPPASAANPVQTAIPSAAVTSAGQPAAPNPAAQPVTPSADASSVAQSLVQNPATPRHEPIPTDLDTPAVREARDIAGGGVQAQTGVYDGAGQTSLSAPSVPSVPSLDASPVGPTVGGGKAAAGAPSVGQPKAAADTPAAPAVKEAPFWDKTTGGLMVLGAMTGATVGVALALSMGPLGILIGALFGAALAVGVWKAVGYKDPEPAS